MLNPMIHKLLATSKMFYNNKIWRIRARENWEILKVLIWKTIGASSHPVHVRIDNAVHDRIGPLVYVENESPTSFQLIDS